MVTGGWLLIAISYKYNACMVISFIVIDDLGIPKAFIPCLYRYPDQFSNVEILPVALPLVIYKF